TALSAALGMASARDLKEEDNHVVAVAGDAAFTCGPTLEALNNIDHTTDRLIVVLNDNEWSIDRNVGAMAKYFNALQTHPMFSSVRHKAAEFVGKIGGDGMRKFAHKVERNTKNLLLPSVLFEKFGLHYYGPIDGHDLPLLIRTFEHLKNEQQPVILHIITEKGRGYKPALENPGKFHGLGTYKIEDGSTASAEHPTYSELFGRAVTDFAKEDKSITAITAAMPGGTKLDIFKKEVPERYFDVGIAEEHAALFACGHATQGLKPFLAIYSTFMQRAIDMIIHDIALQNLPVRMCMDRGGLSGDDGPTHHGLFDIAYLRAVPGLIHMQPKDEDEFIDMLWTMANHDDGPTAIRYPRGAGMGAKPKAKPALLEIGKGEILQDGEDIAIISLGHMYEVALETVEKLEAEGHSVALINPRFIKPLDAELITSYARKCQVVLTMEDHVLHNGFGASIIELLSDEEIATPVERIGWPDEFVEHGKVDQLREQHGLTADHAVKLVTSHLKLTS
ncbi:MAG: 1-deoxy-D-xylulose-5-phosphate synthase, partial [Akkermansiaceae bacterium]